MMTKPRLLTPQAKEIAGAIAAKQLTFSDLLSAYEGTHAVSSDDRTFIPEPVQRMLRSAAMSPREVAIGNALNDLMPAMSHEIRRAWHDLKVRLLLFGTHEQQQVAISHLTAEDYDSSAVTHLVDVLSRGNESVAMQLITYTAYALHPAIRADVLSTLVAEVDTHEKACSERAAMFALLVQEMFVQHADAIPDRTLLETLIDITTRSLAPASFVAVSGLLGLFVERTSDFSVLVELLESDANSRCVLGVYVLQALGTIALTEGQRARLAEALDHCEQNVSSRSAGEKPSRLMWLSTNILAVRNRFGDL